MDSSNLQQSLETVSRAIESLKAGLQASDGADGVAVAPGGQIELATALANLATKLAQLPPSGPLPPSPDPAEPGPSQEPPAPVEAPAPTEMPPVRRTEDGEKLITIPVRQRTGLSKPTPTGTSNPTKAYHTLELPATPFHPKTSSGGGGMRCGGDNPPPSTAKPPPPHPTPTGIPADTPMAAEVLASLGALGLQLFPTTGAGGGGGGRVVSVQPQYQQRNTRGGASASAIDTEYVYYQQQQQQVGGRKAAAVRAATTSAALAPRPRKKQQPAPSSQPRHPAPPSSYLNDDDSDLLELFGSGGGGKTKENTNLNGGAPGGAGAVGRKMCNCKRSQCLKLYCECFSSSGYCLPGCQCINCLNTEAEEETVEAARTTILAKNPRAFTDKVVGDAHKKGCRCKRSKCLKKYCECYNAGVKCNPEVCQCEGCHNMSLSNPGQGEDGGSRGVVDVVGGSDGSDTPSADEQQHMNTEALAPLASISAALYGNAVVSGDGDARPTVDAAEMTTYDQQNQQQRSNATDGAEQEKEKETNKGAATDRMGLEEEPDKKENIPSAPTTQSDEFKRRSAKAVSIATALGNVVSTPGTARRANTSALTSHLSDMLMSAGVSVGGGDGEVIDTATSPAIHGAAAVHGRRMNTMTAATKANPPSHPSAGGAPSGTKRPRRAASGGVQGAVAAATSDWGLDIVSPPPKRSYSVPDAAVSGASGGGGTAVAARRERTSLLRRAVQNDMMVGNPPRMPPPPPPPHSHSQQQQQQQQGHVEQRPQRNGDEADAISVLVSLNAVL